MLHLNPRKKKRLSRDGMKFTADGLTWMPVSRYRLREDYSWRQLGNRGILDSDLVFQNPFDCKMECDIRLGETVVLDGHQYKISSSSSDLLEGGVLVAAPHIHRQTRPKRPSRQEMETVLYFGGDDEPNTLILDIYGYFRLVEGQRIPQIRSDPRVAVYCELPVGQGYLGQSDFRNKTILSRNLFKSILNDWVRHLKTGILSSYAFYDLDNECTGIWERLLDAENRIVRAGSPPENI